GSVSAPYPPALPTITPRKTKIRPPRAAAAPATAITTSFGTGASDARSSSRATAAILALGPDDCTSGQTDPLPSWAQSRFRTAFGVAIAPVLRSQAAVAAASSRAYPHQLATDQAE